MRKLTIYDNTKTYYYPSREEATPERVSVDFPIVNATDLKLVIETDPDDGIMFYTAPEPINNMARGMGLNPADYSTDEELLQAMEDILNAPQPEPEPSAEERIAAAMEYQNLMSI